MKNIATRLHRFPLGLKHRIILMFTIFTTIPLGLAGIFLYNHSIFSAQRFMDNYIGQTTAALNIKIEVLFNDAISILNIGTDRRTRNFLESNDAISIYENAKQMGNVFQESRKIRYFNHEIFDISIIGASGHCVSERFGYFTLEQDFFDYPMVRQVLENKRVVHFSDQPDNFAQVAQDDRVLSVSYAIFEIGSNELNGIIKVDINKETLYNILMDTRWSAQSLATIVNTRGNPIFANSVGGFPQASLESLALENTPMGNTDIKINQQDYLVAFNTLVVVPWKLIIGIPRQDIMVTFSQTSYIFATIIFFAFIMIFLINIVISNRLVRPVVGLKNLMKRASEGEFDMAITYRGRDEISDLYRSFEKMVRKIKQLLDSLLKEQAQVKTMELKALQTQINPHFLYNTLDSVVRVAESGKNDEVIELIMALSNFYKSVLSSGKDIVPLSSELDHIRSYLQIMKKRYHDILSYEITADDRALQCLIPKITLQPIVENAIYHGIKNVRQGGKVAISIRLTDENQVVIHIQDDGLGMREETLADLIQSFSDSEPDPRKSFGLKNVNTRLQMFFGPGHGIQIESTYHEGTLVTIEIPCRITSE